MPQSDARDPRGGSEPVEKPPVEKPQLPRTVIAVAAMTLLEAALLLVLALVLVIETIIKDPQRLVGSLGGAALALAAAAVLVVLVPHLRRCRRFARTPVVVLQILWLPVGFSLTFQSGLPEYGIPVLICALSTLGLFAAPSARAALMEPVED